MIPLRNVIPSRTTPVVDHRAHRLNMLAFLYELTLADRDASEFITA